MATDKRGRKLPKGIQQRYEGYEGRFMYKGKRILYTERLLRKRKNI